MDAISCFGFTHFTNEKKLKTEDNEKTSMLECIIAGISDVTYSVRFNIKINSLDIYGKNCIVAFLELLEKTFSI